MGKAKMVGQFKPFLPNSRADSRKMKLYRRNQEYTERHEEIMAAKREARLDRELVAMKMEATR